MLALLLLAATLPANAVPDQVAQAVADAFPTHDTDGDGKLSEAEFAAWMTVLRARSGSRVRAHGPATRAWVASAFRMADKDRDTAVTPNELTSFMRQG